MTGGLTVYSEDSTFMYIKTNCGLLSLSPSSFPTLLSSSGPTRVSNENLCGVMSHGDIINLSSRPGICHIKWCRRLVQHLITTTKHRGHGREAKSKGHMTHRGNKVTRWGVRLQGGSGNISGNPSVDFPLPFRTHLSTLNLLTLFLWL